jgi:AraC-like DNA-binding protein
VEPREFWERNSVLAEAFCSSDDKVRQARAILDEAHADRARTLAAFAVTVGSDGAVADLMGLNAREVRVARRTVGKADARSVADRILTVRPEHRAAAPTYEDEPVPQDVPLPQPRVEMSVQPSMPAPPVPPSAPAPPAEPGARPVDDSVVWSDGMDFVLQWSWQSGLDLQTVAEELGLSPRTLLLRAQYLAAEGRLSPRTGDSESMQPGRHRRNDEVVYTPVPDNIEGLYHSPAPHDWAHA